MSMENIFGVEENIEESMSENTGEDFILNLSDEDLDAQSAQYVPIPAGTITQFRVYEVETTTSSNGNPQWKLSLRTVEDTWGPNKQVSSFMTFSPKNAFIWGPFLKGLEMVQASGSVNIGKLDPESLVGKIVQARVQGYSWKDASGSYHRSYGKNKKPIPTDGTPYYEELTGWKLHKEDEEEGMSAFSSDSFI